MDYVAFESECDASFIPRIGGGSSLPADIAWPADQDGAPMLHLMTLSSACVSAYSALDIPSDHCVSVFIPFKPNSIDHVIALARKPETARIFAHPVAATVRQECPHPLLPAHAMQIVSDPDRPEEDEFSDEIEDKIGGGPCWLQDRIDAGARQFFMQLAGATFNESWPSHRGIFMGGILYLFLGTGTVHPQQQCGQLTVQFT